MKNQANVSKQRRWFLTPCGLDCYGCSIRLRTKEELNYWAERNVDLKKIQCGGCRSERNEHHWSPDCRILQCCIYEHRLEFCAQCPDFPCQILEEWGKEHEHHARAVVGLMTMKEIGLEKWLKKRGMSG